MSAPACARSRPRDAVAVLAYMQSQNDSTAQAGWSATTRGMFSTCSIPDCWKIHVKTRAPTLSETSCFFQHALSSRSGTDARRVAPTSWQNKQVGSPLPHSTQYSGVLHKVVNTTIALTSSFGAWRLGRVVGSSRGLVTTNGTWKVGRLPQRRACMRCVSTFATALPRRGSKSSAAFT